MNRILRKFLGLSLVASSILYASGDHMGNHMHEGKMTNHMNPNGAVSMEAYHQTMMVDGYKTIVSSIKPLKDGKNDMTISILKNKQAIKTANVNITFSMPAMPGMEFTQNAGIKGNKYTTNINFSMGGKWAYELMFKTNDGSMHKTNGSVNIK